MTDADQPTTAELIAVLCGDQRQRWSRGERTLVETYLAQYAFLVSKREPVLDLVYNEICLRSELGETPDKAEYVARFPQFEHELTPLFEVHQAIETDALSQVLDQLATLSGGTPETDGLPEQPPATDHDKVRRTRRATADDTLTESTSAAPTEGQPPEGSLRTFGDYEILAEVAEGGMGVVYRALQRSLDRIVALKMIRSGDLASQKEIDRFHIEATAAAHLQHPNIVAIHEVGQEGGQHFFSMDYVDGPTLAQLIRDNPLPPSQAVRYVRQTAEAVHYAHQQHILHRDLKPANILIDSSDQPRITDFGLAKQVDSEASSAEMTAVVGTSSYMPPEQIDGRYGKPGQGSDVYSLGAMLYELVTGRPPFRAANVLDTLQQVVTLDPVRPRLLNPSIDRDLETICLKCLEKDSRRRYDSAQDLADDLARYENRDPIAARPVSVVERTWRKCRKRPLASLLALFAVMMFLFIAVAGPIVALEERRLRNVADEQGKRVQRQLLISTANRITAQAQALLEDHPQRSLLLAAEALDLTLSAGLPPAGAAEQFLRNALTQIAGMPLAGFQGKANHLQFSPDNRWLVLTTESDSIARLWDFRQDPTSTGPVLLKGHGEEISTIAFSPDSRRLITASWDRTVRLWDLTSDDPSAKPIVLRGHNESVYEIAVSPNGRWLATGGGESTVRLWYLAADDPNLTCVILEGHRERIGDLAITPNSQWLVTTSVDGTARLWNLAAARPDLDPIVLAGHQQATFDAKLSPDSRWLATAGSYDPESREDQSAIRLWDLTDVDPQSATYELPGQNDQASVVTFGPRGHWLLVASANGPARMWDLTLSNPAQGEPLELPDDGDGILAAVFSPDGRRLATRGRPPERASRNHYVRLWNLESPSLPLKPLRLPAHAREVRKCEFSPNGTWLITSGADGTVALWRTWAEDPDSDSVRLRGHEGAVETFTTRPDGKWLATAAADMTVRLWDIRAPGSNAVFRVFRDRDDSVVDIAVSSDGSVLATSGEGNLIHLWRVPSPESRVPSPERKVESPESSDRPPASRLYPTQGLEGPIRLRGHKGAINALGFSRHDQRLISVSEDHTARIWETQLEDPSEESSVLVGHTGPIRCAAISPDGRWLLTGSSDRSARLWDLTAPATTSPVVVRGHKRGVLAVAIGPENRRFATSGMDGLVLLWTLTEGEPLGDPVVLDRHDGPVFAVAFDRYGQWLISGGADGTARLWNLPGASEQPVVLHPSSADMDLLRISPDHRQLVTTDYEGTARVWDLGRTDPREKPCVLYGHPGTFTTFSVSPDARFLVSGATDGTVRIWDLRSPSDAPIALRGHRSAITCVRFTPDNRWVITADQQGVIRMWCLRLDQLIHLTHRIAGRTLTAAERRVYLPTPAAP